MDQNSYVQMERELALLRPAPGRVLDVGSRDVNGTYRPLFPSPPWEYIGVDIVAGDNVDLVMPGPYTLPFDPGSIPFAITGQCLEHCEWPWQLAREIARVLAPGGYLVVTAPAHWPEHRLPLDCWRILPDGMRALFAWAGLSEIRAYRTTGYCWGVAQKAPP